MLAKSATSDLSYLGVPVSPNLDVCLEKVQTAFDPPPPLPIFENLISLFRKNS